MGTHFLVAWLTARQNACLHGHLLEVLQLTVDVKVPDAAVEAGAILPWRLAQRRHIVLSRHACKGTSYLGSGFLGVPQSFDTQKY
jgi:hypothetical protein